MCIRFLIACCLFTPAVVVSAQGYSTEACDGNAIARIQ